MVNTVLGPHSMVGEFTTHFGAMASGSCRRRKIVAQKPGDPHRHLEKVKSCRVPSYFILGQGGHALFVLFSLWTGRLKGSIFSQSILERHVLCVSLPQINMEAPKTPLKDLRDGPPPPPTLERGANCLGRKKKWQLGHQGINS